MFALIYVEESICTKEKVQGIMIDQHTNVDSLSSSHLLQTRGL